MVLFSDEIGRVKPLDYPSFADNLRIDLDKRHVRLECGLLSRSGSQHKQQKNDAAQTHSKGRLRDLQWLPMW
jgi:hypothetical protein